VTRRSFVTSSNRGIVVGTLEEIKYNGLMQIDFTGYIVATTYVFYTTARDPE